MRGRDLLWAVLAVFGACVGGQSGGEDCAGPASCICGQVDTAFEGTIKTVTKKENGDFFTLTIDKVDGTGLEVGDVVANDDGYWGADPLAVGARVLGGVSRSIIWIAGPIDESGTFICKETRDQNGTLRYTMPADDALGVMRIEYSACISYLEDHVGFDPQYGDCDDTD